MMKVTAGIGSIDDYPLITAEEVFIGYVPDFWIEKYGRKTPINRREVIYVNVQAGSMSELMILRDMMKALGKGVAITFNSLSYTDEQRADICNLISELYEIGFSDYIISDIKLIEKIRHGNKAVRIHVSGEFGEMNSDVVRLLKRLGVSRIIFPRQTTIEEMKNIIQNNPELEYEAFILNEKCEFTGAYCNSYHGDELCHMCRVPYKVDGDEPINSLDITNEDYIVGKGGCGLCALYKLKAIGITYLKVVGRGNSTENIIKDTNALKEAISIENASINESDYISKMKRLIFPKGCSKRCYYLAE